MKKTGILIVLLAGSLLLGGCALPQANTNKTDLSENVATLNGKLTIKSGDEYLLSTKEGIVNITSKKENLDTYLGKNIKVSGMYSGSTLYVDKIELE